MTAPGARRAISITAWYGGCTSCERVHVGGSSAQTVNAPDSGCARGSHGDGGGNKSNQSRLTASATSGVTHDVYESTTSGFTPSPSNLVASGVSSVGLSGYGV